MIDTAIAILLQNAIAAAATTPAAAVYSGSQRPKVTQDLPKVLYTRTRNARRYTDDGNTGLTTGVFQLDVFAATPSQAAGIADDIRVQLDGYSGTEDGTRIERIYFDDDDRPESPERIEGEAVGFARFKLDLIVEYRERTS